MLNEREKKVICSIQGDVPVCARPYLELAQRVQMSEDEFLAVLAGLCQRGVVRRFGATLRHQASGFTANAMVAWQVDKSRADAVGELFAAFSEVSHCYRRVPAQNWPYNLYTMVHARDEEACRQIAQTMAARAGVAVYTLLFSRRELKKTSMKYFTAGQDS